MPKRSRGVARRPIARTSGQSASAVDKESLHAETDKTSDLALNTVESLFAQHYAEAGLAEKSVACWGMAGQRPAARSAMVEAAAQLQRGLDQLALLPDTPERKRQEPLRAT
jgi:predicted ATPase